MNENDQIEYSGPDREYKPPIGDNKPLAGPTFTNPEAFNSYANLNQLKERLKILNDRTNVMQETMERVMDTMALVISDDDEDAELRSAHAAVWPESLGEPAKYIPYRYYKILKGSETTASNYIQRRYEEAARDLSGDTAFDLLQLVDVIKKESSLIDEFINSYVGNLDDSSEYRTVEIFQDWVESALTHTKVLSKILVEKDSTKKLPERDASTLTPKEARKSQAVFKVKLNSLNGEIASYTNLLQRNFSEYSEVFYKNFLGPAVDFRLKVSRYMYPTAGRLSADLQSSTSALNANLSVLQADQLRRLKMFDTKLEEIEALIVMRNQYRGYIKELAPVGKPIPAGQSGTMTPVLSHNTVLDSLQESQSQDRSSFKSSHAALADTMSDDAHPQYLLRSGGHMTGDITMDFGLKIDGMSPATHAHTGGDGTFQLSGASLAPGSVDAKIVNRNVKPPVPTGFKDTAKYLGDLGSHEVKFEWQGESGLTYEIQIARME